MSEIRVNRVVDEGGSGAPEFPQGSTSAGVVTAVSFSGSGANLTGIASTDNITCLLYTSPSPRDGLLSRMPSSA